MDTATHMITNEAHPDANIIWGATFDPKLEDEMRVTVIATGFVSANKTAVKPAVAPVAPVASVAPVVPTATPVTPVTEDAVTPETVVEPVVTETKPADEDDDFTALINMLNRGKK